MFLTHEYRGFSLNNKYSSAGAETTYAAMSWFVLAMITNPEIQKRAQAELDAVVGRSRVPTFSDASSLPYVHAIVKEVLRWRPPLPLSIPHCTTVDDWYDGMFIPKGTICLPNLWLCHHDQLLYGDDAAMFNPGRFLDAKGRIVTGPPEARDDGHSTYGFGRRACPGKHVANDSLFIFVATVLWASTFERAHDRDGKETPLDTNSFVYNGVVWYAIVIFVTRRAPFDLHAAADQFHTSATLNLGFPRRSQFWQRKKNCSDVTREACEDDLERCWMAV